MNPLGTLQPPPLSPDFAGRVVAAALDRAPSLASSPTRRVRRPWMRRGIGAASVTLCGLLGAAAAATGVFGERIQQMPVISVIAERIEAQRAPRLLVKAAPDRVVAKPSPVPEVKPVEVPNALPPHRQEATVHETRIAERLERINSRRAAAGRPPIDRQDVERRIADRKARVERRIATLPPKRQERVRAVLAERAALREAAQTDPVAAEQLRVQLLERRTRMKMRQERRAQRRAGALEPLSEQEIRQNQPE